MHPVTIVLLVILVILIGLLVGLYFFGKKTQKKQEEQQAQIEASKQTVSMLVIDKKRMPLKESVSHRWSSTRHRSFSAAPRCRSLRLKLDRRFPFLSQREGIRPYPCEERDQS